MRSIVKTIECDSRSDVFTVVLLGDVHLGARACDEALFQQTVQGIRDAPNTFWIGMGDMAEAIHRHDPRHREETMATWLWGKGPIIKYQRDRLIDLLKPIGPKCLCYLIGNHEDWIDKDTSSDCYLDVIEAIRATPETDLRMNLAGFLTLRFRRMNEAKKGGTQGFVFYLHHGWVQGDGRSAVTINLERLPEGYVADIYAIGHTHKPLSFPTTTTAVDRNGKVIAWKHYHVNTGGFLKNALPDATTYTEAKGKRPVPLGAAEIELTPYAEDKKIRVIL